MLTAEVIVISGKKIVNCFASKHLSPSPNFLKSFRQKKNCNECLRRVASRHISFGEMVTNLTMANYWDDGGGGSDNVSVQMSLFRPYQRLAEKDRGWAIVRSVKLCWPLSHLVISDLHSRSFWTKWIFVMPFFFFRTSIRWETGNDKTDTVHVHPIWIVKASFLVITWVISDTEIYGGRAYEQHVGGTDLIILSIW